MHTPVGTHEIETLAELQVEGKLLETAVLFTLHHVNSTTQTVCFGCAVERQSIWQIEADTVELRTVCISGWQSVQRSHERLTKSHS